MTPIYRRNVCVLPHFCHKIIQTKITREKEQPLAENCLHQTGLQINLWVVSWLMTDVEGPSPMLTMPPLGGPGSYKQGSCARHGVRTS